MTKDFHEIMRGLAEDGRLVSESKTVESGQTEIWVRLVEEADA